MSNKYIKNVETKVNKETVEITVTVTSFDDHTCREKVSLRLSDIRPLIVERKIKVGRCIQNPILQNKRRTTATWIFEKPQPKVQQTPKRTQSTRSSKKRKIQ